MRARSEAPATLLGRRSTWLQSRGISLADLAGKVPSGSRLEFCAELSAQTQDAAICEGNDTCPDLVADRMSLSTPTNRHSAITVSARAQQMIPNSTGYASLREEKLHHEDLSQSPVTSAAGRVTFTTPLWGLLSIVYGGALHPTAEGYAAMADAALPAARQVFELPTPPDRSR